MFMCLCSSVSVKAQVFKCTRRNVTVQVQVWKCQCVSVSVEVSVFKDFPEEPFAMLSGKTNILQRTSVNLKRLEEQNCILVDLSCIGKPKFIHERVALFRVQNSE